jgi:hypothetical protein
VTRPDRQRTELVERETPARESADHFPRSCPALAPTGSPAPRRRTWCLPRTPAATTGAIRGRSPRPVTAKPSSAGRVRLAPPQALPAGPWLAQSQDGQVPARSTHLETHPRRYPISIPTCEVGRVRHGSTRRWRPSTDKGRCPPSTDGVLLLGGRAWSHFHPAAKRRVPRLRAFRPSRTSYLQHPWGPEPVSGPEGDGKTGSS